jgi:hypothetical protein
MERKNVYQVDRKAVIQLVRDGTLDVIPPELTFWNKV